MAEPDPLKQVSDFLKKQIYADESIIQKFKRERVDKADVSMMTDKDLIEMGLEAKGDRVKLKAFCQSGNSSSEDERAMKKRKLKEILEAGKSLRLPQSAAKKKGSATPKAPRKPNLKFQVRWKHYVPGVGYKLKRSEQGGGMRVINLCRNASAQDCLQELKRVFFHDGQTGNTEHLDFDLCDFQCQPIDLLSNFSPESYKSQYNLHTPRLCLLSKEKEVVISSEASDDEELLRPAFSTPTNEGEMISEEKEDSNAEFISEIGYADDNSPTSDAYGLIGTSQERQELLAQMQAEYDASLNADREKEEKSTIEASRKEALRKSREKRVPAEPIEGSPRVMVSVRHPMLGGVKRSFTPDCKISAVYDWVGSLAASPEYFSLSFTRPRSKLHPEDNISLVSSSVLYMLEEDKIFSRADDVSNIDELPVVQNDGIHNENWQDDEHTVQLASPSDNPQSVLEIPLTPPGQLLEEDEDVSASEQETIKLVQSLNAKRQIATENLVQEPKIYEVSRHNCVKDLLSIYKDETIAQRKILLQFKDEDAVGDGVSREVFSVFCGSFFTSYCEGTSNFIFSISAAISPDDYVTLGRILTHQFIQTGTFPLQLSEAAVQQAVVGKVSDACLVASFLQLLHENEREVLQRATSGAKPFPTCEVVEILSDYGVQMFPNADNVQQVISQVSATELTSKPFICLAKLREGMGPFWESVNSEEVRALYSFCTPNHTNVVNCLQFDPESQQENKVYRWLTRYLRSKDRKILSRFIRFCTGCDVVLPYQCIKIKMENMSGLSLRPKAQTCFRVLTIPKNYQTHAQLSDNIDFYLCNPQLWDLSD